MKRLVIYQVISCAGLAAMNFIKPYKVRELVACVGLCGIAYNGRGYEIVAEYEAIHFRTAQSYIRAKALQVCTTTAMFYSLC